MAYQPQGPVYNPPQQQIVTVSTNPNIQAHFNSVGSRRTGYLQLVCGCICVLLGIVAIFIRCYMSGGYFPIWSGLLFFITPGIAGIMAAKSRTTCSITSYMVLSIFASLFSFCLVWVMLGSTLVDAVPMDCKTANDCSVDDWSSSSCSVKKICTHVEGYEACVAIDVILLFTALTEFIVSIVSAAICCRGVCCKGSSKSTSYTTVSQNVPSGTVVIEGGKAYTVAPSAPQQSFRGGYPPPAAAAASYPPQASYPPAANYPPPPADPAYPPVTGEKPPYPEATAPSAPALDQPPTYEQSVGP